MCLSLPLAFIADLSSLLCLWVLRVSALHSAITLTLFTLALRSGRTGELWLLRSEPGGVLEGDTDWLVGQPVSSIVNGHTDSNSREQAAWGRQVIRGVIFGFHSHKGVDTCTWLLRQFLNKETDFVPYPWNILFFFSACWGNWCLTSVCQKQMFFFFPL